MNRRVSLEMFLVIAPLTSSLSCNQRRVFVVVSQTQHALACEYIAKDCVANSVKRVYTNAVSRDCSSWHGSILQSGFCHCVRGCKASSLSWCVCVCEKKEDASHCKWKREFGSDSWLCESLVTSYQHELGCQVVASFLKLCRYQQSRAEPKILPSITSDGPYTGYVFVSSPSCQSIDCSQSNNANSIVAQPRACLDDVVMSAVGS